MLEGSASMFPKSTPNAVAPEPKPIRMATLEDSPDSPTSGNSPEFVLSSRVCPPKLSAGFHVGSIANMSLGWGGRITGGSDLTDRFESERTKSYWTCAQFGVAADRAASRGVDSIRVKRSEIQILYSGS